MSIQVDRSQRGMGRRISDDELHIAAALAGIELVWFEHVKYGIDFVAKGGSALDLKRAADYIADNPPVIRYMHYRIPADMTEVLGIDLPSSGPTPYEAIRRYFRGKMDWTPAQKGGMTRCMMSLDLFDEKRKRLRRWTFWGVTYCSLSDQFSYAEGRKYALKDMLRQLRLFLDERPGVFAKTITAGAECALDDELSSVKNRIGAVLEEQERESNKVLSPLFNELPEAVKWGTHDAPENGREYNYWGAPRRYGKSRATEALENELELMEIEAARELAATYAAFLFGIEQLPLSEKMSILADAFPGGKEGDDFLRKVEAAQDLLAELGIAMPEVG